VDVADRGAERVLSAAAHGAIAFGLFGITFLMSLVVTGVIWLYSRRSPRVRFHAEQAGCYQCLVILVNLVLVAITGASWGFAIFKLFQGDREWASSLGTGGLVGLVLFAAWFLASILYGVYAAILVLLGREFKYPIIGDRFKRET
jgi:uncharacterized Tic20 family protein